MKKICLFLIILKKYIDRNIKNKFKLKNKKNYYLFNEIIINKSYFIK